MVLTRLGNTQHSKDIKKKTNEQQPKKHHQQKNNNKITLEIIFHLLASS